MMKFLKIAAHLLCLGVVFALLLFIFKLKKGDFDAQLHKEYQDTFTLGIDVLKEINDAYIDAVNEQIIKRPEYGPVSLAMQTQSLLIDSLLVFSSKSPKMNQEKWKYYIEARPANFVVNGAPLVIRDEKNIRTLSLDSSLICQISSRNTEKTLELAQKMDLYLTHSFYIRNLMGKVGVTSTGCGPWASLAFRTDKAIQKVGRPMTGEVFLSNWDYGEFDSVRYFVNGQQLLTKDKRAFFRQKAIKRGYIPLNYCAEYDFMEGDVVKTYSVERSLSVLVH